MNWKKRVRKIAETDPDALHPIFKSSGNDSSAWYRVEWNKDSDVQTNASKLLLKVFYWLMKKGLLTSKGLKIVKQAEEVNILPADLSRSDVTQEAKVFLDLYFDRWLDEEGFNLIINPKGEKETLTKLEEFWIKQHP
jgi:hypothetical protein